MNKNAIKKFAIDARNKLIASVTDKAGMLGITPDNCSEVITKGADFEVYKTAAGTEVTLNKKQCEQRRKLVDQIHARGFEAVVEEVAYTWFNRICAIRFMEVNDYMYPVRVRVLSSEKEGKNEPDVVTMAPDIDWDFTDKEREEIIDAKMNNRLDDLFRMLFIKQCNLLHEVLPGLFEETEDYTEMLLNISFTNEADVIRMLIDEKRGIPEEDFNVNTIGEDGQPTGQVEIIGWLYQYYNTELKDDTFAKLKKNVKITKERIPAATQLFTPDWIVRYMVENSVGRIWIEHLRAVDPSTDEKATAEKFGWKYYLPEAEQEEAVNVKLAEIRTTYKDLKPTDITCIDPCMGSGHILIAMFDVLMDIYESAGYDKRDAALKIVKYNIHGIDIDKRAYQLAYFAIMMKGRGVNRRFLTLLKEEKFELNVFPISESNEIKKEQLQFFGVTMLAEKRNKALSQIRKLLMAFVDAKEYGSIIRIENLDYTLLYDFINDMQEIQQVSFETLYLTKTQEQLFEFYKVSLLLNRQYNVAVTNPPYMGNGGMNDKLSEMLKMNYPSSKNDMSTVFMESYLHSIKPEGYLAMINIPVWMFIKSYAQLRKLILENYTIINMLHLGRGVFGADFGTTSFVIKGQLVEKYEGFYKRLFSSSSAVEDVERKLQLLADNKTTFLQKQNIFKYVPEMNLAYWANEEMISAFGGLKISDIAYVKEGLKTGDNERFIRYWTEVDINKTNIKDESGAKWIKHTKGGEFRKWYGNNFEVLNYEQDGRELKAFKKASLTGKDKYFQEGVTWSRITIARTSFRYMPQGYIPNMAGLALYSDRYKVLLGYLNSIVCRNYLEILNPTINFPPGTIAALPIDVIDRINETEVEQLVDECIRLSKVDWDSFENSWDYRGDPLVPCKNELGCNILISDMYGKWEKECNDRFNKVKENEERINDIFINAFHLSNSVSASVDEKEVTIHLAEKRKCIQNLLSFAVGCMLGRYTVEKEGIYFAGGEWIENKSSRFSAAEYGIIPITDEECFDDDIVSRLCEWLISVYGYNVLDDNLHYISEVLETKGNTAREKIRYYFINEFYTYHCNTNSVSTSGKRPIYWLFSSGKNNAFKCLIYMHRYDADTVGRVRTDYLHKAQKYVETAMQSAQYTIDNATSASEKSKATKAVTKYTKQLAEMKIYDEAIAHVANQRIEIDLDDGVKVNYAKFQGVEVAQEGKKALKIDLLAKI